MIKCQCPKHDANRPCVNEMVDQCAVCRRPICRACTRPHGIEPLCMSCSIELDTTWPV